MKDTDKILQDAGETIEYAKQYIQHQKEYLRLEMAGRMSKAMSKAMTLIILLFFVLFIIMLLSISVALFLGEMWGSYALGFFCVTGIYILLSCFIYVFKNAIIVNPTVSAVIKAFLKNEK